LVFAVGQLQRESRIAEKCGFIRAQIICQKLGYTRLKARIKSPDGVFSKPSSGSPQGGIIRPVLANIYLHYALDLWQSNDDPLCRRQDFINKLVYCKNG
jgi:retron-type reverse transcriptase